VPLYLKKNEKYFLILQSSLSLRMLAPIMVKTRQVQRQTDGQTDRQTTGTQTDDQEASLEFVVLLRRGLNLMGLLTRIPTIFYVHGYELLHILVNKTL
jgi:hypothetical protein